MALLISTLLAVAAYLLKNEVFDPLRAFKGAKWKAATLLVVHESTLTNIDGLIGPGKVPGEAWHVPQDVWDAKADIRRMAAELNSAYAQIPVARSGEMRPRRPA